MAGVFKEAGRLQGKYFSLLAPFIFAFVLPMALVQLLEVLGLAWGAAGQNPFLPPGPHPGASHGHRFLLPRDDPAPPTPSGRALLLMLAVGIVMWLLGSLAVASFCKTVESIYSEQEEDPSVIKSIFKSLPGAIFRLLVTSVWVFLLMLATICTITLPFILLSLLFQNNQNVLLIFAILQQVFLAIAVTILGFMFLLSQEVAVLEPENYGLAALKRSSKLVQEKFLAALTLFVVSSVVGGSLSNMSNMVATQLATGKLPPWTVYILAVLFLILYLAFMVYVLLVTVVLYFSSKVKYDANQPGSLPVDNPYTPLVVVSKLLCQLLVCNALSLNSL